MSAAPAQDKKKVIVVSIFGVLLLLFLVFAYNAFFGGSTNPAAVAAPAPASRPVPTRSSTSTTTGTSDRNLNAARSGMGLVAGVAATKMASTSSSLDPTLDESAMLRTESLVYSGTGRNIFSTTYTAPIAIPKNVPKARPNAVQAALPTLPLGPPPPPPINLKFFGTALRANGVRQAFLLNGEDVYLAGVGDIVARKYKILSIGTASIQVEDLQSNNIQSLPLLVN
ncbi:MAG TPA: hypothetical protein VIJ38_14685 [Acidobacteriaceae bacterium]